MYCNLDKAIFESAGQFDFPIIKPFTEEIHIDKWLGFNYIKSFDCNNKIGCHFFLDDYQFETLWDFPNKYIDKLKSCGAVISTDFSVYTDFPKSIQIYNAYRNHWLAKFYQNKGVNIIPNMSWSNEENFYWQFDGYPKKVLLPYRQRVV